MFEDDELRRYVTWYQSSLLAEGSVIGHSHDSVKEWTMRRGGFTGYSPETWSLFYEAIFDFKPATEHESVFAQQIFGPVLERVVNAAESVGWGLSKSVLVVTSTEESSAAMALPSAGSDHLIFVGSGLLLFCNYWGKVYSSLADALRRTLDGVHSRATPQLVASALGTNLEVLSLAVRLATFHAERGSLVGFGEISHPSRLRPLRMEYVDSMEIFAIAHEYAHCMIAEALPDTNGSLSPEEELAIEVKCDRYAAVLSTIVGGQENKLTAFTGVGGLLLFRAIETCHETRRALSSSVQKAPSSNGHPPASGRVHHIAKIVSETMHEDERELSRGFFAEMDVIACTLRDIVVGVVEKSLSPGQ